jgi:predicted alpha/beta-fold hydrolase
MQELYFKPFPLLSNPHLQTLLAPFLSFNSSIPSEQKIVSLACGDRISLEISTPKAWKKQDPTVVLVHGLCSSHKSAYVSRLTKSLNSLDIRVVRFNMRCCGSGWGLAKRPYHAGRSDDLFQCIKLLKSEYPESKHTLIGWSLGANIVLKLAGELGRLGPDFISSVFAISPPVDLFSTVQKMEEFQNRIYEKYFVMYLRLEIYRLHALFSDLPQIKIASNVSFHEFNEFYTAPICGFKDALDYYKQSSSIHVIPNICIPCKILFAKDDPLIAHDLLDPLALSSDIEVFKTKHGGHLGFLGDPKGERGFYWMDSLLTDWVLKNCKEDQKKY